MGFSSIVKNTDMSAQSVQTVIIYQAYFKLIYHKDYWLKLYMIPPRYMDIMINVR